MSQNISIGFKVTGSELSSYMDNIQKKSRNMANEAIQSATEQAKAGKEILDVINKQTAALERKSRMEMQAARSILLEKRESDLQRNRDFYDAKKNEVFADSKTSEQHKKEKITAITGLEKDAEERIKSDYKDNLTVIKEQERQAKLQTGLTKELIENSKQQAERNVKAITNGDLKLADVIRNAQTEDEKLVASLTKEGVAAEKKKKQSEKDKDNVLTALLKTDLIRSAGGMVGQIPNAKNELDFVKPITSLLGMAIGGAIGTTIDLVTGSKVLGTGVGQTQAGVIGAEMGKVVGEFVGGSLERAYKGREDLTVKNFHLQALTGVNYGIDAFGSNYNGLGGTGKSRLTGNLSRYGLDYGQTAELQAQLAKGQGTARNLSGGAENVIALEKGLGVTREATNAIIDMQRSSTENNKDFLRTITGVLNAGKNGVFKEDRTFLSEFLGKFTSLQKELLKTQSTVATGTTMDILNKFESIGGQFSARDPRSMGYISSLNNSLINPGSDFKKALSFFALRQNMGAGTNIADILEEQQKGLGSESYRNSIFKLYSSFGDDSSKRLAFADLLGGNVDAGTKLLRAFQGGKFKNGEIFGKELTGGMSEADVRGLGESQVGQYTRSSAEIQNMFIDDVAGAVIGVGDKMRTLFGSMIDELEEWIVQKIRGSAGLGNVVVNNNTKKPKQVITKPQAQRLGLNQDGSLNMSSSLNKF